MKLNKEINNEFEQELIDSGYLIFKDSFRKAIRGFEKKVVDKRGIKYFIHVFHYNIGKQHPNIGEKDKDSYVFTSQMTRDKYDDGDKDGKDQTVDISFSADFLENKWRKTTTLKEAEDFFEDMFQKMKFDYCETY